MEKYPPPHPNAHIVRSCRGILDSELVLEARATASINQQAQGQRDRARGIRRLSRRIHRNQTLRQSCAMDEECVNELSLFR